MRSWSTKRISFSADSTIRSSSTACVAGNILVTYRTSDLSPEVLDACELVLVTRVADQSQALALRALVPGAGSPADWLAALSALELDEACLLPGAPESGHSLARFRVGQRLTSHVRHRSKYVDVPVRADEEFVFTRAGRPTGGRARTVAEILALLPDLPDDVFQGHPERGDFRRWFEQVLGDRELGAAILPIEQDDRETAREAIRLAIEERYVGSGG